MDRRNFFTKLISSVPEIFFLGIQVVFPVDVGENITDVINSLIRQISETQSLLDKKECYNELVKVILNISKYLEFGYWDFIINKNDAQTEFGEWLNEFDESLDDENFSDLDNKAASKNIDREYLVVTMAFLINGALSHENIVNNIRNISEKNYNDLSIYKYLLQQVSKIDFNYCESDTAFVYPYNKMSKLTLDDLENDGWEYLVPIDK